MSWYNPLSWGQNDPEKYDPNSANAVAARTFGGPNHAYDVQGATAQGAQLDTRQADQARGQQQGLASSLNAAMSGQGPSGAGMAAAAQRDSNLSQAAALQGGRRGQSSAVGIRAAGNQVAAGNQQAAQAEAIGRTNEMAQARGEYGNLVSNIRSQDLGTAGQNAQLAQNSAQYNAANRQQATLANQGAQLGIGSQELGARQHQGDMEFTNLDPGSTGYFGDIMTAAGNGLGAGGGNIKGFFGSLLARGGVVSPRGLPRYGGGVTVGSSVPSYPLMGIGQRRTPVSKGDLDQGRVLAQAIVGFSNALAAADKNGGSPDPSGASADNSGGGAAAAPAYAQGPMTGPNDGPVTSPMQVDQSLNGSTVPLSVQYPHAVDTEVPLSVQYPHAMAHGGVACGGPVPMAQGGLVGRIAQLLPLAAMFLADGGVVEGRGRGPSKRGIVPGPETALVGEAGPEAIVDIRGVVDRPTVTTLGSGGRAQAVIPLSPERADDRTRVLGDIVRLLTGRSGGAR